MKLNFFKLEYGNIYSFILSFNKVVLYDLTDCGLSLRMPASVSALSRDRDVYGSWATERGSSLSPDTILCLNVKKTL